MSQDPKKCPVSHLTTAFGAPVTDNQNSLTAGARGPHPQVQRHPGRLLHRQRLPHAHAKNPPQRGAAAIRGRDRSALPRYREPGLVARSTPAAIQPHPGSSQDHGQAQPLAHAHTQGQQP